MSHFERSGRSPTVLGGKAGMRDHRFLMPAYTNRTPAAGDTGGVLDRLALRDGDLLFRAARSTGSLDSENTDPHMRCKRR